MEELLKSKEIINNNDRLYIETKNKSTNGYGCANFINQEDKIKVYEGNPDGSDDKVMTYKEFLKNYTYKIKED